MTTPSTIATWNPERVAQLRNFVGAGLTCSQIAAEIGVTRNAVIGKIHRLGLGPGRPAAAPGRACPPRTRRPRLSSQRQMLRLIAADAPLAAGGTVIEAGPVDSAQCCSLLELDARQMPLAGQRSPAERGGFRFLRQSRRSRASPTAPATRAWPIARRSGGGHKRAQSLGTYRVGVSAGAPAS